MVTKEEINGYFLEAIRRLKAQGYTQKDIVEAAGLSQNAISKIKMGQNNAGDDTINKLCTAFKLNPDFFYRGSNRFSLVQPEPQVPTIDPSSAINAAISAYAQLVEAKNAIITDLEDRVADLQRTIADKDTIIRDREARIIALERQLADAAMSDLYKYPFAIGAAEDKKQPNI